MASTVEYLDHQWTSPPTSKRREQREKAHRRKGEWNLLESFPNGIDAFGFVALYEEWWSQTRRQNLLENMNRPAVELVYEAPDRTEDKNRRSKKGFKPTSVKNGN